MNENRIEQNGEIEVDLQRIFSVVLRKAWIIIIASVIGAVISIVGTRFLITPLYESSAMFYVNNNDLSVGNTSFSISSSDITASKNLVDSYIVILNTRTSLNDVIDYAGVNRTFEELQDMITAASVNETEIFEVVVTSPDPVEAEQIASAIAYILPKRISSIIEGTSAKIVDAAVVAAEPSSPSYINNTLIGFLLAFVLSLGIIVLQEIFDITIRAEEDIAPVCSYPILAVVPDMNAPSKGGYYEQKKNAPKTSRIGAAKNQQPELIGGGISFAASEAYKLLRTKLQFSFADENDSHVIGISSSLSGEGKSLTAVNLAYMLSQLDKNVILIDCDMRRPTLADKLAISKRPGLSNCLTGQTSLDKLIQQCGIPAEEEAFDVIAAGPNPPNPIELLSSARMSQVIAQLKKVYDYIILDFPPVGEVSDAMAVAKETDGILLVVRENHCNRPVLSDTIRQFEFIGAKILGVIYNGTTETVGKYGKKYYKKYYGKYEGSYEAASREKFSGKGKK